MGHLSDLEDGIVFVKKLVRLIRHWLGEEYSTQPQPRRSGDGMISSWPLGGWNESDCLGALSRCYESGGDPGRVSSGHGDPGGISYGTYQLSTKQGSMGHFLEILLRWRPDLYARLQASGEPGSRGFTATWQQIAREEPGNFFWLQHQYAKEHYYDPAVWRLTVSVGMDLSRRSRVIHDVIWSTAIQHGLAGTERVFRNALGGFDSKALSDRDLIAAVYRERGRDGGRAWFGKCSPQVREGVVNRFYQECMDALQVVDE